MSHTDRRTFLQMMGVGSMASLAAFKADIAKRTTAWARFKMLSTS